MAKHSAHYELARQKYLTGAWNKKMLQALVAAGRITQKEFDEIVEDKNG